MMIYLHFKHGCPVDTSLSVSLTCFLPMESCDEQAAGKDRVLLFNAGCKVWDLATKLAESRYKWEREKEKKSEKLI